MYICTLRTVKEKKEVIKCFHSGRMFCYKNGHLILSPFREYPHLVGREVFRSQQRLVPTRNSDGVGLGKKTSS